MTNRFVILSGCSGGGKSTLLGELAQRGFATQQEPGRRIVAEALVRRGSALPWVDPRAFLERALALALEDRRLWAGHTGWVFFDRGLVDAASGIAALDGGEGLMRLGGRLRYHKTVFFTPPWPEIYVRDPERRHTLDQAQGEYDRLLVDFPRLGYDVVVLPKTDVVSRANFVMSRLGLPLACRRVRARQ